MKKIMMAACVIASAASVFAFDIASLKPKGKVNEYTKTVYSVTTKFGDYYRSPKLSFVHTINEEGQETESIELTNKGILTDKLSFEYDKKGNQVACVCTDSEGNVSWKTTTAYDEKGNKTEVSEYNANGALMSKSITKTNPTTKTIEESMYDGEGVFLSKYISKVDDLGKLAEVCLYNSDGALDEKTVYTYNDLGNLVEQVMCDGTMAQISRTVNKYDPATGYLCEIQIFGKTNKLSQRVILKYDDKGNIVRETTYQVAEKFGSTVNELIGISEYAYRTDGTSALTPVVEASKSVVVPVTAN